MRIYAAHTRSRNLLAKMLRSNRDFGILVTPSGAKPTFTRLPTACDNGAFECWQKGIAFDQGSFYRMLRRVRSSRIQWVVCPDIVASEDSLEFSIWWERRLRGEWPLMLAVQDGMSVNAIESYCDRFVGLFVGGTIEWKKRHAAQLASFARRVGMSIHIGRVNTVQGMRWAEQIGADSIDGTGFVRWPWMLDAIERDDSQLDLAYRKDQ